MSSHTPLGPGREFDAIRALLSRWGPRAHTIGDDAALVEVPPGERLVVSTDTSIEDVHFRRAWLSPGEIGWRATTAGLSDLAAMGARPLGVLVALTVPESWRAALGEIADGIGAAVEAVNAPIIGGDLNGGQALTLGITVLGSAARPLLRSGARPGDALWLTGALGGPGAALTAWHIGGLPSTAHRERFARPAARIAAGQWLAAHGACAAIDISDGLVSDARHVAAASGVALHIDLEAVPIVPGVNPTDAISSGEEYELLVAAPAGLDAHAFASECGLRLTRIGEAETGSAGVTVTRAGVRIEARSGHDHFSP